MEGSAGESQSEQDSSETQQVEPQASAEPAIPQEGGQTSGEAVSGTYSSPEEASGSETTKTEWQKSIEAQIKELNRDRISVITILGVFVAIFTFISIEVQILRYICDFFKILGFTLILPGVLLLFITLLDHIARSWIRDENDYDFKSLVIVILLSVILISTGLYFSLKVDGDWRCKDTPNNQTVKIDTEPFESNINVSLPDTTKVQLIR